MFSYFEQRAREVNRFIEMKKKGTLKLGVQGSVINRPQINIKY
jgi:hypothetical protein